MTQSQAMKNQRTRGVHTKSICKTNGKENMIIYYSQYILAIAPVELIVWV